jgi:hypothetical protein
MLGGALFWFFVAVHFATGGDRVIRYDCNLAEISPDYPLQVKEDCRKLRAVHI